VERLREFCDDRGFQMFEISAVTGYGIDDFVNEVGAKVEQIRTASQAAASGS
jgi:hypothetical protein